MPTNPSDIFNCESEDFFQQMVKTKAIFKRTGVLDSRGQSHVHHNAERQLGKHLCGTPPIGWLPGR
jgi:hypothetical protein